MTGGPPCQPFSKAAQWTDTARQGLEDERSKAILSMFDLIETCLPDVVFIENVRGFLKGETSALHFIEQRFDEINSQNSTHYEPVIKDDFNTAEFGVPQKRKRAILLAFKDESISFTWPDPTHKEDFLGTWSAIGELSPDDPPEMRGKYSDLLPSVPEGKNYQYFTEKGDGMNLFGYRTRFWSFLQKLSKRKPSWTIPAKPSANSGPFHWENRPLSVKERLRLQSFPENWEVAGDYKSQIKQVGNAAPPLFVETIARSIGRQIFNMTFDCARRLKIDRVDNIPKSSNPEPVPSKYHDRAGDHDPHPGAGKGPSPVSEKKTD